MKKKSVLITIVVMCLAGTCMHFVCDLLPGEQLRRVVGLIFPFNETSWEHMKMVWYPFLTAGIVLALRYNKPSLFSGMVAAAIPAMLCQLGIFAFYQSLTGTSVLILDIVFYLAGMILFALLGFLLSERRWAEKTCPVWVMTAVLICAGITYLTLFPGNGYVFMDDADFAGVFAGHD